MKREHGYLYTLPLGINWMSQADLGVSPAVVYENGVPLASPNSEQKEIRILEMAVTQFRMELCISHPPTIPTPAVMAESMNLNGRIPSARSCFGSLT